MRLILYPLLALLASACAGGGDRSCPTGSSPDAARAARVVALASVDAETRGRLASDPVSICFDRSAARAGGGGETRGELIGAAARLPADASDAELAARLAHLSMHARQSPYDARDVASPDACVRVVERAARLEREAHQVELRVAAALGAEPPGPGAAETVIEGYRRRCTRDASRGPPRIPRP